MDIVFWDSADILKYDDKKGKYQNFLLEKNHNGEIWHIYLKGRVRDCFEDVLYHGQQGCL